jgi:peptide/nickel transport system substrate-binding protein
MEAGMGVRCERTARTAVVLLAIALSSSNPGCSKRSPEKNQPTVRTMTPVRGGRVVIGIQQEPEMLNNVLQVTKVSRLIGNAIFSRFVTYDDSMRLVPDLITEIPTHANGGISADNLTYTYHLRPARWHDGQPLTSDDVLFTYQAIMNPQVGAESQQGWDQVDRVDTPDAQTVVFHLKSVYASFVADTFFDEDVLPRHLLGPQPGAAMRTAAYNRAPVGSGPFKLKEWVPGSHLTVTRFDDYYGGAPNLDEIVFKIVPDANALAVQLQAGDLDGYEGAEGAQVPLLQRLQGVHLYRTTALQYENVAFNCENPILADVRVRQALALATDRDAIAAQVYEGLAQPARADIHPLLPWYNPRADSVGKFAPEQARALLAAAGWVDANHDGILDRAGKPLHLEINTTAGRPGRERTEAVLQQQWRQVGVDLSIRNYNGTVLFGSEGPLRGGKFDMALFGWTQPVDPAAIEVIYGSKYVPPDGQNMGRFRNARFDSLAALGTHLVDPQQRTAVYRDIEALLLREMPVIPLVWLVELDPMTERLHEFRPNPSDAGNTWNVRNWWLSRPPS